MYGIAQYESGARNPKEAIRKKLAKALGVPIEMLNIPHLENSRQILLALIYNQDMVVYEGFLEQVQACLHKREEFEAGGSTKPEYDAWRIEFVIQALDKLKESFTEKQEYVNIENMEKRLEQLSQEK